MSSRAKIVLFSLAGALAVHVVLVACSPSSGAGTGGVAEGTAHADTPSASACSKWQVRTFVPKSFTWSQLPYTDDSGKTQHASVPTFDAVTLDQGWEPISAESFAIYARQCVQ